jgi:hypothetical protein
VRDTVAAACRGTVGQVQHELDEVAVVGRVDDGDEQAVAGDVDGAPAAGAEAIDKVDFHLLEKAATASLIRVGVSKVHGAPGRRGLGLARVETGTESRFVTSPPRHCPRRHQSS